MSITLLEDDYGEVMRLTDENRDSAAFVILDAADADLPSVPLRHSLAGEGKRRSERNANGR
jgi:hypothetical protein